MYTSISKFLGEKVVLPIQSTNHTYDYSTFITGCKYWNKSEERWASDGCTVSQLDRNTPSMQIVNRMVHIVIITNIGQAIVQFKVM